MPHVKRVPGRRAEVGKDRQHKAVLFVRVVRVPAYIEVWVKIVFF